MAKGLGLGLKGGLLAKGALAIGLTIAGVLVLTQTGVGGALSAGVSNLPIVGGAYLALVSAAGSVPAGLSSHMSLLLGL